MVGQQACHNFYRNLLPSGKDELAREAPTEGSNTHTPTPDVSHAPIPAPVSTLPFSNELFKRFIKAYLEIQT